MHRITYPYNCPPLMVQKWGSVPLEVGCFRFLAGIVLEMAALGLGRENDKIQSIVVLRSTTLDISQRSIFVLYHKSPAAARWSFDHAQLPCAAKRYNELIIS